MQQFGVQFYQASLTARDIDKLVRFEVLSYGAAGAQPTRGGRRRRQPKVNWICSNDGLPRAIAHTSADHPAQDRGAHPVLRAVPAGARLAVDPRRGDHLVGTSSSHLSRSTW